MKAPTERECQQYHLAIQDTLYVVNGKWKLVLLAILMKAGPKRFGELTRTAKISPRILSKELQELETNQMVSRKVCDTKPVTVEYSVTAYAKTLKEVLDSMSYWGVKHRVKIIGK
jgi:DNA-binding HxlR family transcriptional regulator